MYLLNFMKSFVRWCRIAMTKRFDASDELFDN